MSGCQSLICSSRLLLSNSRLVMCGWQRHQSSTQQAEEATTKPPQKKNQMMAWQVHSFGGIDQLGLTDSERIPKLLQPNDILVRVNCTSVNPIDLAMISGYGSSLLNLAKQAEDRVCRNAAAELSSLEFPVTPGRDFVGEVVECGAQVRHLRIGDVVWGVIPPYRRGAHAQFVQASADHVLRKPENVDDVSAACVPYAGLTAWSALWAPFSEYVWPRTKVLVLGGSGGVGSLAVQMLKAFGSRVVTTCKTDAVPTLESFGLEAVIDYTSPDYSRDIKMCGPYDLILNAAGLSGTPHIDNIKEWRLARYVTLSPPLLRNSDEFGVPVGTVKSVLDASMQNLQSLRSKGALVQWGFFAPSQKGLQQLGKLVADGKVKPVVHKKFKFSELPEAFKCQQEGHLRGKIVVVMDV
ncbi:reticulon-4-interacting protein 1 homolog, mitochondrial-like [Neocloeon triangulifer]|uniref:reticulon-4-interacting protein 1 homolog, mitochondrial-like n=1 Tax=Neocloeon triangulifer TaxID=2078957 RepID=UPI00286EED57|nr:reticulon-4-interacting protein 1 homolog, mitochondrial-like [Neocloeon triangulifer]